MPYIYQILDPIYFKPIYVGSSQSVVKRFFSHMVSSNNCEISSIMEDMKSKNIYPLFQIIEKVSCGERYKRESFHINRLTQQGYQLFNKNLVIKWHKKAQVIKKDTHQYKKSVIENLPHFVIEKLSLANNNTINTIYRWILSNDKKLMKKKNKSIIKSYTKLRNESLFEPRLADKEIFETEKQTA